MKKFLMIIALATLTFNVFASEDLAALSCEQINDESRSINSNANAAGDAQDLSDETSNG